MRYIYTVHVDFHFVDNRQHKNDDDGNDDNEKMKEHRKNKYIDI